jgi:hypothetical protein
MDKYIDKLTIFSLCTVLCLEYRLDSYAAVPFIVVVIVSGLLSYLDCDGVKAAATVLYAAVCCFYPVFLFFIPVICYDVFMTKYKACAAAAAVPRRARLSDAALSFFRAEYPFIPDCLG